MASKSLFLIALSTTAMSLVSASGADAQTMAEQAAGVAPENQEANDAGSASNDIIVTARRREERAIDVPASLNVFSGEGLEATGVNTLNDLQYQVPGLKIATGGGGSRITLRGVGTNISSGSPSVAVHLDGIYVPVTSFAIGEQFDVGRVEVLKGPQGTLYGRNATGGVVNIISQAPGDSFAADAWAGYGSRNLLTAQGGVSIPLGSGGGIRVSGAYANDDGYTTNVNAAGGEIDNRDVAGGRIRGRYEISEALTADFTVQYSEDRGTVGFGGSNNPGSPTFASFAPARETPRRINIDTPPRSLKEGLLLSGTLSLDLGAVTLRSLTGYVDYKSRNVIDVDGAGGLIAFTDTKFRSKSFSQEVQLTGGSAQTINWTLGAYYAHERSRNASIETDADFPDPTPFLFSDQVTNNRNRTYAVFGEVNVPITNRLSVLVGGRYTKERQSGQSVLAVPLFFPTPVATAAAIENDGFAPKLLVSYKPADNSQIYASVTRGFKSGGVNLATRAETFQPEKIWAYELGTKNSFADGRAEIGISGFYYDYSNLQLRSVVFTPTGFVTSINNASKASIKGIEATVLLRPSPDVSFDFNGSFIDSELKNFILPGTTVALTGRPLPLAPKFSATAGVNLAKTIGNAGRLSARAEVTLQSDVSFPNFTDLARERQDGYALVNANLRYDLPGDRIYVAVIGRNLTNKQYLTQRFFFAGFADVEFYGVPRSIEGRVGFKF